MSSEAEPEPLLMQRNVTKAGAPSLRHDLVDHLWKRPNATFERAFEQFVRGLRTDEGREVSPLSRL